MNSTTAIMAERHTSLFQAVAWRKRAYGYICLMPREYEAVSLEHALIQREYEVSYLTLYRLNDRLLAAYNVGRRLNLEDARREYETEQARIGSARARLQHEIGRRMSIKPASQQAVSKFLSNADRVLSYFAYCEPQANYGWRQDSRGVYWLAVPIAPVDPITRRKLRGGEGYSCIAPVPW